MNFFQKITADVARFLDRIQPDFWRRMKLSYRWALAILILASLWIASGAISGSAKQTATAASPASQIPRVQTTVLAATDRDAVLTIRGRTSALHSVELKAEVDGVVQAIHFEKGDRVKTGQVLCELKLKDRAAKLAQAQAMVTQTSKQHQVDVELAKDGFRSTTQVDQS